MNLEQLGLLGVFLAGATPWLEVEVGIPAGLLFGNAIMIFLFAYSGSAIRDWIRSKRKDKTSSKPDRFAKAQKLFDRYGIFGLAALAPVVVGTQFAAAIAVAAGVKPLRAALLINGANAAWAIAIASLMLLIGLDRWAQFA